MKAIKYRKYFTIDAKSTMLNKYLALNEQNLLMSVLLFNKLQSESATHHDTFLSAIHNKTILML